MSTSISSYFIEEIINWNHALNFYCNEIDELNDKLQGFIRTSNDKVRPSIDECLYSLKSISGRFSKLQVEMFGQERLLQPDNGSLLSNSLVHDKDISNQDVLRLNVQAAEKEYVDIKFRCYQLMASLTTKQHPVA